MEKLNNKKGLHIKFKSFNELTLNIISILNDHCLCKKTFSEDFKNMYDCIGCVSQDKKGDISLVIYCKDNEYNEKMKSRLKTTRRNDRRNQCFSFTNVVIAINKKIVIKNRYGTNSFEIRNVKPSDVYCI